MIVLARRQLMLATATGLLGWRAPALALAPRVLAFPRDHGSHPDLRTEWWYITGQARSEDGRLWGFQITFFRSRVDVAQGMRSAFAARQLIFAHAALTDVQGARQWHDQRIARAGFGVAGADEDDARIRLHDWSLARAQLADVPGHSRWAIRAQADGFALDLQCTSTQPVLLQGQAGLSRKGPDASQASYYVSQPQLVVSGVFTVGGQRIAIAADLPAPDNRAWMDHEWSEALMHPQAVGWDWIGMNLADGGALTAFSLRRADGSQLWAGGSLRRAGEAQARIFGSDEVVWTPLRRWTSGASGATYPVDWRVDTPAGRFTVQALLDAQELDSRASTGAIYWEGLCRVLDAQRREVGRGYLEMTGYAGTLSLT